MRGPFLLTFLLAAVCAAPSIEDIDEALLDYAVTGKVPLQTLCTSMKAYAKDPARPMKMPVWITSLLRWAVQAL